MVEMGGLRAAGAGVLISERPGYQIKSFERAPMQTYSPEAHGVCEGGLAVAGGAEALCEVADNRQRRASRWGVMKGWQQSQ
jgi:hypothetical protein